MLSIDAASIMSRNVVTVSPEESVRGVAGILAKHSISAAPVCAPDGTMLGLVSEYDLMRQFGGNESARSAWWLDVLAEGEELAPEFLEYVSADNRRARDVMSKVVVTADERTTAAELAELMTRHDIKSVPVLRDGKVVGIVSRSDVVRVVAGRPVGAA